MPKKAAKKKVVKRIVTKKVAKTAKKISKVKVAKIIKEKPRKQIGRITHFYTEINVGVIELTDKVKVGDTISIEGETTKFKQKVDSMQIDRKPIKIAVKGQEIGLKVKDRVREHDIVYKVE